MRNKDHFGDRERKREPRMCWMETVKISSERKMYEDNQLRPNKQGYYKQDRDLRQDFFKARRENMVVHTSAMIIR